MRYAVPCDPPKWATVKFSGGQVSNIIGLPVQLSELSQYDDSNVLTHGGLANRTKRGRRPLDMPDDKNKVGIRYYFSKEVLKTFFVTLP